jgi:hypothetical protein
MLTLDTLGERYGRLPSEILASGSTLDIAIMDAALSYHNYQHQRSQGKYALDLTNDELQEIVNRSRRRPGNG